MNGKGSKPRPIKNIKIYGQNWDSINWVDTQESNKKPKKRPPKP